MELEPGMKIPNFPYNRHFFQPGMKIWYYARMNSLFIFKKLKMETSQGRFKWTDEKPINLRKCLQELDSLYVQLTFSNIDSFQCLQGFEVQWNL